MKTANVISPGYVCHSPRLGLYGLVTGYGRLYCDYHGWGGEFPKTQIMWAKQLEISSADSEMCNWFIHSLDYCKNLIIIDPRATAYASRATLHWIQPRPGSDCALAMGMMNVIIKKSCGTRSSSRTGPTASKNCASASRPSPLRRPLTSPGCPRKRSSRPPECGPSIRPAASRWAAHSSARPTAATPCGPSPA
jgi:hypothetical protein